MGELAAKRDPGPLAVVAQTLSLPLDSPPSLAQLEELITATAQSQPQPDAEESADPLVGKVRNAMRHWAERTAAELRQGKLATTAAAEIQVISLGDMVLAGVPGEFFVELGLQIKREAGPRRSVLIAGFANGNIGYIPARRAYPHGGYEIGDAYKYYGYPAVLAPAAGEQIIATAVRLIHPQSE